MSDIVVNKVINFLGKDQLTPTARKVKQAMDNIKDKNVKLDATADEQKIVTFNQKLQGLPKDVQTTLKAMAEKNGFDNFDSYIKSMPKNIQTELKAKFDKQVFESAKKDYESLPKEKITKLETIAEKQGFTDWKMMFNSVPKKARTQLDFVANKGEFAQIQSEISKITKPESKKVTVDTASVDTASKKFGHLKEIIAGTFAGQLITSGVQSLTSGLKSATQAGMEYNKEQDTMKTVWTSLTTEAPKDGKELVDYINSLSQHSIYAADTINKMSQSFYHVHSNVKETKDWTNSFIALGSTLHMSNDALAESGEQFAKIVAGGKASSEDMSVMINRFPMFGEALQQATGKSMKQLYDMSAAGKLSAEQFTETLSYLGKKYSGGTQEAMTSYMGMGMYIHSRFSKLMGDIMSQTFNTTKSASGAIRDLLSDDAMQKYSKAIGSATATVLNGIGDIIKYVDGHKDTIMKIGKDVGEIASIFGKAVWNDMKSIMTTIASMFGLTDKNAKNSADPLKTFESILSSIAKHKTAIKAIAGYFVAMKGFKLAKGVFDPLLKVAGIQSKGGGLLTKAIGSGKNEKKVFRFSTEGFNDTKAKFKTLKDLFSKVTQGGKFSKVNVGDMSKGAKIGTGVTTAAVAGVATMDIVGALKAKNPEQKFEGFGKAAGGAIGGGIGFMLGGPAGEAVGALIGRTLGKYGGKAAKEFTDGWNKAGKGAKPPKGIIQKAGYYSRKAGDAVVEWTKGITTWMGKHKQEILLTLANPFLGIGDFILKDTKTGKDFQKWASNAIKGVQKGFKSFAKSAKKIGSDIVKSIVSGFKGFGKMALYALALPVGIGMIITKPLVKPTKKIISGLVKDLKKDWNGFTKWLGNIFDPIAKSWGKDWKKITKAIDMKKFSKDISKNMAEMSKSSQKTSKDISKQMSDMSKSVQKSSWVKDLKTQFNSAQKTANSWGSSMSSWWSDFSSDFSKSWDSNWSKANSYMGKQFKGMSKWYNDFSSGMNSWWNQFSSSFKSGWDSMWSGIGNFFKSIFAKFNGWAKGAMKDVVGAINTGIGGINTVIHFFGGKAQSITPIKYASGVGYHPGGPALINDQKGPLFEEAFRNPGEPWRIIPKMRNVMVDLKPGATVVPATETARRFAPSSVPHYANGVGGWIKGELSDMGKWVKDKLEGITSFLKDPLGNLISVWDKATSKITQPTKFGNVFAPPAGHYVVKQSINWFKDQMNKLKDQELEAQSAVGGARPAKAYGSMIRAAAAYMHQSITDFNVDMIERIIGNESGGDPNVTNNWDSNARAGHPSTGILQYILPTFLNYAMPGHTNIHNPLDQLIALFNDATWRSDMGMGYNGKYGEWRGSASGPSGPRLMANGGHVFGATNAIIGEAGDEFAINPAKPSAIPLIGDLMGRMADYHPEFRASNLTSNISADLGQKLDIVINLLGSIEGKNFAPEINIARTSSNLNQQNRRNTDIYAYQRGDRQ
ncbi:tape measure protein [Companilactobacillus sp. HBUAS56257]|uniref:tape measure protein n=1 Tax=Companilactobacillus sp. HBUAS56257 TaxID=3109360 RepID=UPI002FF40C1B